MRYKMLAKKSNSSNYWIGSIIVAGIGGIISYLFGSKKGEDLRGKIKSYADEYIGQDSQATKTNRKSPGRKPVSSRVKNLKESSKQELYKKASQMKIRGRSKMNRAQLLKAIENK
jgi:uncharacterized protein YcfJ